MPNVIPAACTCYPTGRRYFYFLNSWSQHPSQRGRQLSLRRLELLRIQQNPSCHLPAVFTKELPLPRTQLGWSRIPQAQTSPRSPRRDSGLPKNPAYLQGKVSQTRRGHVGQGASLVLPPDTRRQELTACIRPRQAVTRKVVFYFN